MNTFLSLSEHERTAVFQDVGAKMNIPPGYVEKDFWVCWMLDLLFSAHDLPLVFRGGTSLSKAYQVINRFSEDIDLSISREWLGITSVNDPVQAENKSQADKFQKHLRELTREKLTSHVLPKLEKALADLPCLTEGFSLTPEGENAAFDKSRDPYCIFFSYPSLVEKMPAGYISAQVKLEFSARAEGVPAEVKNVQSFASDHYPQAFSQPVTQVLTVEPQRTFLEKAFIIHEANTAPETKTPQIRLSRHYYDLFQLIQKGYVPKDSKLFGEVKAHRQHYFRQSWVNYETLTLHQFQISPPSHLESLWRNDYEKMGSMIWGEIPDFNTVLSVVTNLLSK